MLLLRVVVVLVLLRSSSIVLVLVSCLVLFCGKVYRRRGRASLVIISCVRVTFGDSKRGEVRLTVVLLFGKGTNGEEKGRVVVVWRWC
jgi:hypothetical protein